MQSFWNTTSSQPILHRSKKPTSLLFLLYRETSNAVLWNHYIVNPFTIPLKSLHHHSFCYTGKPLKAVLLQHYITPINTSHLYPRSLIASVLGFVRGGGRGISEDRYPASELTKGSHTSPHATPTSVLVHEQRAGLADGASQHAGDLAPDRVPLARRFLAEPERWRTREWSQWSSFTNPFESDAQV